MKYPIKWHEKGLKHSLEYEKGLQKELFILLLKYIDLKNSNLFRRKQIDMAIKENIKEFDPDKYMVSKK